VREGDHEVDAPDEREAFGTGNDFVSSIRGKVKVVVG